MDELIKQVLKTNRNVLILAVAGVAIAIRQHKKIRELQKRIDKLERMNTW